MSDKRSSEGSLKRLFDIGFSSLMLVGLSPLLLAIAAGIKISSEGDVIYIQERLGKNRKPFKMYKFRTMVKDAEQNGPQLTALNDPRVTKLGRLLRKYHLDELTQFWNVLIGDMSVVGPRPEREYFVREIEELSEDYSKIFEVKPGITSLGMVKYGYASDIKSLSERSKYDLDYVGNPSAIIQSKIILETVKIIFKGKGN